MRRMLLPWLRREEGEDGFKRCLAEFGGLDRIAGGEGEREEKGRIIPRFPEVTRDTVC